MPGNIISINDWAESYVGDSKMPELARALKQIGFPHNKEAKDFTREAKQKDNKLNKPQDPGI